MTLDFNFLVYVDYDCGCKRKFPLGGCYIKSSNTPPTGSACCCEINGLGCKGTAVPCKNLNNCPGKCADKGCCRRGKKEGRRFGNDDCNCAGY